MYIMKISKLTKTARCMLRCNILSTASSWLCGRPKFDSQLINGLALVNQATNTKHTTNQTNKHSLCIVALISCFNSCKQ